MRRQSRPKIGDCFSIELPDGKKGFGQFVCVHPEMGTLIRVFDIVSGEDVPMARLEHAGLRFPPVFTNLIGALRSGAWRVIGHMPLESFELPKFRTSVNMKTGVNHDWIIWDGNVFDHVGDLPVECRSLELRVSWGYGDVVDRIVDGDPPFLSEVL